MDFSPRQQEGIGPWQSPWWKQLLARISIIIGSLLLIGTVTESKSAMELCGGILMAAGAGGPGLWFFWLENQERAEPPRNRHWGRVATVCVVAFFVGAHFAPTKLDHGQKELWDSSIVAHSATSN